MLHDWQHQHSRHLYRMINTASHRLRQTDRETDTETDRQQDRVTDRQRDNYHQS